MAEEKRSSGQGQAGFGDSLPDIAQTEQPRQAH